jgi:hypothetical protein
VARFGLGKRANSAQQQKRDRRNSAWHRTEHGILPFGYLRNEGKERPTGGLVDAPSSKAVEEAGHCEELYSAKRAMAKGQLGLLRWSMGIIDNKFPGTICLSTDHFGAEASRRFRGLVRRSGIENPISVQQRQTVGKDHRGASLKSHSGSPGQKALIRISYQLLAYNRLTNDEDSI